jgi:ubiquinone/menaquinone biosynthesis C-methylase UbiE
VDHPGHPTVTGSGTATALHGFSRVDDHPDGAALIAALDEQAGLPAIERLRAHALAFIAPTTGQRLLDAGCGTGEVARHLAAGVGPPGEVIGIDASDTMVREAGRRTTGSTLPVQFRVGDICHLDAEAGEFAGVYCERVFQHLDDPAAAMSELVRVTRADGRIVVVDTDWGMHAIHGADPDLTATIVTTWARHAANGWVGRQLPALLVGAGTTLVDITMDTITSRDPRPPSMEPFATMAAFAREEGALTAAQAETWLGELANAGSRGTFFWAITLIAVCAIRR